MKNIFLLTTFFVILFALPATAQLITTIAGNGTPGYTGDNGPAVDAEINEAYHIFVDHSDNVYIADLENSVIRKINANGIIITIAGNNTPGYSGDNGPATLAQFNGPFSVAVDDTGSVYVADHDNCVIRKVDTFGIITTIAGIDSCGFGGDGGPATAANLFTPEDIALDHSGNIYIADWANNRIRKINPFGIITTIAGNGMSGYAGDNSAATAAELKTPVSIAVDNTGNIYIGDQGNARVRKIDTSGIITTIAGNGIPGFSGDGTPATAAEIKIASGLTIDSIGSIYIADALNNRIRKIDTSGIINTIAGNGSAGFGGDGVPLLSAEFNSPTDIKLDVSGNLFIADAGNNRIRSTRLPESVKPTNISNGGIAIFPNPSNGDVALHISTTVQEKAQVVVTDIVGTELMSIMVVTNQTRELQLNVPDGVYSINAQTTENKYTQKIIVMH